MTFLFTMDCSRARRYLLLTGLLLLLAGPPAAASPQNHIQESIHLLKQGEFAAALSILHRLESRLADPTELKDLIGESYLGQASKLLQAGDHAAALDALANAQDYLPEEPRVWKAKGLAHYYLGLHIEAVHDLETAIGLAADQPDLHLLLGRVHYAAGHMGASLDALRTARDLGAGASAQRLLDKVEREWRLEREMDRDSGGRFEVLFADQGQSDLAGQVLDVLEEAYVELGSDLNYYPEVRVPVLLYSRTDFRTVTRSPDWAGAVYDGKIRIPLGGVGEMTGELRALLYHEYAHVLLRYLGNGRLPPWLNEGCAELAGRRIHDPGLSRLEQAANEGTLLPWARLAEGFQDLQTAQAELAYEQSFSFCAYLVDQFGWHLLRDLVISFGAGATTEQAFGKVFRDYGLTWEDIRKEWRRAL